MFVVSTITLPLGKKFNSLEEIIFGVGVFGDEAHPIKKLVFFNISCKSLGFVGIFKVAPTEDASSLLFSFMSRIVTKHPFLFNVAEACRPVTLAPITTARAGLIEVEAVINCWAIIGELDKQYIDAK